MPPFCPSALGHICRSRGSGSMIVAFDDVSILISPRALLRVISPVRSIIRRDRSDGSDYRRKNRSDDGSDRGARSVVITATMGLIDSTASMETGALDNGLTPSKFRCAAPASNKGICEMTLARPRSLLAP